MTVLKDQSGDPITDSAGTEIKANTTVVDALFGDGITRGKVPLDHGKGVNVLIDWFGPRDPSKPKSRGAEHLTVKFLPAGRRHTGADFESGAVHRAAGVVWVDRSKGPAKLAVDNYGGGSTARLNSWVLLESA